MALFSATSVFPELHVNFYQLCAVNKALVNWLLFGTLSLIWGSSFILIKIGLDNQLSPYQVASIRIVSGGIVLLPYFWKSYRRIPAGRIPLVFLSGALGSLLPAFLFCMAEEGIDSSLAGTLNSLTPIFAIIMGAVAFKTRTSNGKIIGILIAFSGSILLLLSKGHMRESQHLLYISFVVLATICYGINVNLVMRYLGEIGSFHLATVALGLNAIPALLVLTFTGYWQLPLLQHQYLVATGAASLMGVFGTAVATVLFYMLVKRAGGVFSSMVTYGIPFVAVGWGMYYGEVFGPVQIACLVIILIGVFWASSRK